MKNKMFAFIFFIFFYSQSTSFAASPANCYITSASNSGSTFDGRISVGVACSRSTDIIINDQFSTSDGGSARPLVESKQLLTNRFPNGVSYTFFATAGANRFYSATVSAVCCPVENF